MTSEPGSMLAMLVNWISEARVSDWKAGADMVSSTIHEPCGAISPLPLPLLLFGLRSGRPMKLACCCSIGACPWP